MEWGVVAHLEHSCNGKHMWGLCPCWAIGRYLTTSEFANTAPHCLEHGRGSGAGEWLAGDAVWTHCANKQGGGLQRTQALLLFWMKSPMTQCKSSREPFFWETMWFIRESHFFVSLCVCVCVCVCVGPGITVRKRDGPAKSNWPKARMLTKSLEKERRSGEVRATSEMQVS